MTTAGAEAEQAAVEALARGQLIVAPTETIYGVFACDRALLAKLVGDETSAGAARHAAELGSASRALGDLNSWQRRLLGRVLPGPVTVVAGDSAVRVPDHEGCRSMLSAASEAGIESVLGVALPAANPLDIGALTAAEHAGLAEAGVALAIDDGPTKLGTPSTVIRLTDTGYDLVREGAIEARYLNKMVRRVVLFVCTGNTCRSPMAAAIAKDILGDDPFTEVVSAGVSAGSGSPMTPEAATALRSIGVEPGEHRSKQLTDSDLSRADDVFAMTGEHLALLGGASGTRAQLLAPEGDSVPDPFGGSQNEYDASCQRIRELVTRRLAALDMIPHTGSTAGGTA